MRLSLAATAAAASPLLLLLLAPAILAAPLPLVRRSLAADAASSLGSLVASIASIAFELPYAIGDAAELLVDYIEQQPSSSSSSSSTINKPLDPTPLDDDEFLIDTPPSSPPVYLDYDALPSSENEDFAAEIAELLDNYRHHPDDLPVSFAPPPSPLVLDTTARSSLRDIPIEYGEGPEDDLLRLNDQDDGYDAGWYDDDDHSIVASIVIAHASLRSSSAKPSVEYDVQTWQTFTS